MRRIYYYVNECPRCKSPSTGYFVYDPGGNFLNDTTREAKALKNGEIQSIRHKCRTPDSSLCFCMNCGIEWKEKPQIRFFTKKEIEMEKNRRGISQEAIVNLENYKDAHISPKTPLPVRIIRKTISYLTNNP